MSARERLLDAISFAEAANGGSTPEQLVDAVIAARDAEIIAWLVKKAREVRATPKSRQESPADTLARMASKIQRGAVRPSNTLRLTATAKTEPDWNALLLASVKSFRSQARADGGWAEQLAAHLLADLGPHLGPAPSTEAVEAES